MPRRADRKRIGIVLTEAQYTIVRLAADDASIEDDRKISMAEYILRAVEALVEEDGYTWPADGAGWGGLRHPRQVDETHWEFPD